MSCLAQRAESITPIYLTNVCSKGRNGQIGKEIEGEVRARGKKMKP